MQQPALRDIHDHLGITLFHPGQGTPPEGNASTSTRLQQRDNSR